jgi:hypothetical protein
MNHRLVEQILVALVTIGGATAAQAADRYWVAQASGKWSEASSWSSASSGPGGASIPGPGDTAIFDAQSGDSVVDPAYSGTVSAVVVKATYKGNITQQRDLSVTGRFNLASKWTFWEDAPASLAIKGDMLVAKGATLTCTRSSVAGCGRGRTISVGGNLTVLGYISADAQGFMRGPGTPPIPGERQIKGNAKEAVDVYVGGADAELQAKVCPVSPAGSGHGGRGAGIYRNPNNIFARQPHTVYGKELPGSGVWKFPGGGTYGSITSPTSLGSGTNDDPNFDPKHPYGYDYELEVPPPPFFDLPVQMRYSLPFPACRQRCWDQVGNADTPSAGSTTFSWCKYA